MPYPTNNHVISLIWIGEKPLPSAELETLIKYASTNILPVILWADYPNRIRSQLSDLGLAYEKANLMIEPVHALFVENNNYVGSNEEERKLSLALDALQTREAYGAGNIGARVDLLKVQVSYQVGGIVADFDKLQALYDANKRTHGANTIILLMIKFTELIEKGHLLFDIKTGQPDFIVATRQTFDTNILRKIEIEGARYTSDSAESAIEHEKKKSLRSRLLFSDTYPNEPLFHAREYRSLHDLRRSYKGWIQFNPEPWTLGKTQTAKLTIIETGSILMNFSLAKAAAELGFNDFEHQKQKIRMLSEEIADLDRELKNKQHSIESQQQLNKRRTALAKQQHQLDQIYNDQCRTAAKNKKEILPRYSIRSFFSDLLFPSNIYRHSWERKANHKPTSYLVEGANFFVRKQPWREILHLQNAWILLLKQLCKQGVIKPRLMKPIREKRFANAMNGVGDINIFFKHLDSCLEEAIPNPQNHTLNFGAIDIIVNPSVDRILDVLRKIGVTVNFEIMQSSDTTGNQHSMSRKII